MNITTLAIQVSMDAVGKSGCTGRALLSHAETKWAYVVLSWCHDDVTVKSGSGCRGRYYNRWALSDALPTKANPYNNGNLCYFGAWGSGTGSTVTFWELI